MSRTNSEPRQKAADRAADQLRQAILSGAYQAGSALPAERGLAETLGVSRLTLRAAIARLESEGLVRPMHGSGTRVLDFRRSGGLELLGPLLSVALGDDTLPLPLLRELLELRTALAVETLGMAAQRAHDGDLTALAEQLGRLRAAASSATEFMEADLAFARLWVRAAKNLPLELLYNGIERALRAQASAVVLFSAPDTSATLAVYEKLFSLLRERDPDRLRKLGRRVLAMHDARLLRTLETLAAPRATTPSRAPDAPAKKTKEVRT